MNKICSSSLCPPCPLWLEIFLCSLLCVFVASCGWHLQGAYTFPSLMAKTYIDVIDPYSPLVRDLSRSLSASDKVVIVQQRDNATAVLHIIKNRQGKRVLSVSTSGLAREYEVYYVVQYELLSADGEVLLAPQQHLLTRQYLYDRSDILSKNREAAMLIDSMQQDMVRLILRRLAAVEAIPPTAAPNSTRHKTQAQ